MVGPVLAPVSIALVMRCGLRSRRRHPPALGLGARLGRDLLALAVFMIDAWLALPNGREALLRVLPASFNWPLFCLALMLMALPALHQVVSGHTWKSGR